MGKVAVKIAITFISAILAIHVVTAPYERNYDHHYNELPMNSDKTEAGPFYQSPEINSFRKIAIAEQPVTDKVTTHTYEFMDEKYLGMRRFQRLKLLEIGLGCDMGYKL